MSDNYTWSILKKAFGFLAAAAFCAFFGAVYEAFSHGVYSYYMIYAFALPLMLGALPLLGMTLFGKCLPGPISLGIWSAGVAAMTVGCVFRGVLDIYGTTNRLIVVYPIVGGSLLAVGLIAFLLFDRSGKKTERGRITEFST